MATPSAGDLAAFHAIHGSPVLAFLPFLVLKYQKADVSPLDDENHYIVLAFYIATLTYVAAMVTEFKLRIHESQCPNFITNISLLSAPLATTLLVAIIFPYLGWFLFLIWIGFFVKLLLDSYQEFLSLLGDAAGSTSDIWNKLFHRETKKLGANKNHDVSTSATSMSDDCPV